MRLDEENPDRDFIFLIVGFVVGAVLGVIKGYEIAGIGGAVVGLPAGIILIVFLFNMVSQSIPWVIAIAKLALGVSLIYCIYLLIKSLWGVRF